MIKNDSNIQKKEWFTNSSHIFLSRIRTVFLPRHKTDLMHKNPSLYFSKFWFLNTIRKSKITTVSDLIRLYTQYALNVIFRAI